MLISSPTEIDHFLRTIPSGTTITPAQMRQTLAQHHKADACCPVSTGIFLKIVSESAIEEIQKGVNPNHVAPFWKVVADGTPMAKKLSISATSLTELRTKWP